MLAAGAPFRDARDAARFAATPLSARIGDADLVQLIGARAAERPRAPALSLLPAGLPASGGLRWSYAALLARAAAIADHLGTCGVGPTDVVAILLPNGPETVATVIAAMGVGIAAPINHFLEASQIAALVVASAARIVVTNEALAEALRGSVEASRIVLVETIDDSASKLPPARPSQDCVALFHTGGTTGQPKFVPLSGHNLAATAVFSAFAYGYTPGDRVLCAMPMFHVGGLLACSLIPLACGAEVVIAGPLGYRTPGLVKQTWSMVAQHAISVLIGPPTVMAQLAADVPERTAVPTLRLLINGAAALPVAAGNALAGGLGVPLTEPWGLTEATLAVTSMPHDGARRPGSVGVALPYCEVKCVRTNLDGQELGDCAAGEIGILAIQGPSVFAGYRGLPPEKQPWFRDGWLDTGDLGRIDADGYVYVTGRAKDVIKRGGHGIDPQAIEEALCAHPGVAFAAAVGKPDAYAGEVPVAFVQLKPGAEVAPEALLAFVGPRIAERAAIPKEIIVLPALPLTGVGKIHKPPLRLEAARRAFEAVVRATVGDAAFGLTMHPDAERGIVVRVAAPPEHHAALRSALAAYAFPSEVA